MKTDSSHWYDSQCNPCHTIVGKNGKPRKTTIRDARENRWFPSVTTVQNILAKPQLEDWKFRQITKACFDNPSLSGNYAYDAYHEEIMSQAFQQVTDAADLGTAIHKALEDYFQGREYDPSLDVYVKAVDAWCETNQVTFKGHELRLVNKSMGYAGTTDAHIVCPLGEGILDFKTRKTKPGEKCEPYDGQAMQIAAYYVAMNPHPDEEYYFFNPGAVGVNVFISTTEPGRIEASWYDYMRLSQEWRAFEACLMIWKHFNKYDPCE